MLRPIFASLVAFVVVVVLTTGQASAVEKKDFKQNAVVQLYTNHAGWVVENIPYWNGLQNFFESFFWNMYNYHENKPVELEEEQEVEPEEKKEEVQEIPQEEKQAEIPVEEKKQEKPQEEPVQEKKQETPQEDSNKDEPQKEVQQEEVVQEKPQVEKEKEAKQQDLHAFEQEVADLVNKERSKHGLQPIQVTVELSNVAREKSRDMATSGYFSHQSPTYGSPFDMMNQFGIDYRAAGENIAMGQRSPEQVMNGWMNSEGHRANILNENFTHIGVGYVEANGSTYWTQMFIGK